MQRVVAALLLVACATSGVAQSDIRVLASRRDTVRAASTVTTTFTFTNTSGVAYDVTPLVELPPDWSVLTGAHSITIAPGASEVVMASAAIPARTPAGVYVVRVFSGVERRSADSIMVEVPARHGVDVAMISKPGFVVSGRVYETSFMVRNRGNAPTELWLKARSSSGHVALGDTLLHLAPSESRTVVARVRSPGGLESAIDDVVELDVRQVGDTISAREASSRVSIVPEPSRTIDEYLRMPTNVRLRAASSNGVSPFEINGGGTIIDGNPARLDYYLRGPAGDFSPFGERDDYRAQLIAPNWRVRAGDQFYWLSSLTSAAQPGAGLSADATLGRFSFGAHGQSFRRDLLGGSEAAAFIDVAARDDASVGANFVTRRGGALGGSVASGVARFTRGIINGDFELARSTDSLGSGGLGRAARVGGAFSHFAYDAAHVHADTSFNGAQRGASHNFVNAHSTYFRDVSISASASAHRADLSRSVGTSYVERLDIATLGATYRDVYTLELATIGKSTAVADLVGKASQNSVRVRAEHEVPFATLAIEGEAGAAREAGIERGFTDLSLIARRILRNGSVSMWAERYSGGSVTKGSSATSTFGGDLNTRVRRNYEVGMHAYATRTHAFSSGWHSQLDGSLSRYMPDGSSITLRARLLGGGSIPVSEQSVVYLEYGMPFRLPVSKLRTTGRVRGRVIDAVTKEGVANALVRLGPQIGITDRNGEVAFGGVPGGEHRLSMSQETSFANAVFVGDPTLLVDSARTSPTRFELAIARSARVDISVRRFSSARTGMGSSPDSLVDAGPLGNATLVLAGDRDTLYRTTSAAGVATFTDIPPGNWTISIRGDAPAHHRFEPDRVELKLEPGDARSLSFRLVPRRREVQVIGTEQELRPTTQENKSQGPTLNPRTIKPKGQL